MDDRNIISSSLPCSQAQTCPQLQHPQWYLTVGWTPPVGTSQVPSNLDKSRALGVHVSSRGSLRGISSLLIPSSPRHTEHELYACMAQPFQTLMQVSLVGTEVALHSNLLQLLAEAWFLAGHMSRKCYP